ncbi:MBL fold metallo-hydrolase [Reichenbachiella versicolor]|uniref:MBL fold metallo-hydrolase n=1 Tax=Reichenbachiella versicolor TaxID=1821036 RepID=UPI000D6E6A3F|nr:MBL fold metallo-hydrolase [Reichenbachiella versicolor]
MNYLKLSLVALFSVLTLVAHCQSVTYIASEGVLIENKGSKVLIDALFGQENLTFDAPTPEVTQKIINSQAPFNGVKLVLFTQAHNDNFDPLITSDYMMANKSAKMIATVQVVDSLKSQASISEEVAGRITTYPWKKGWRSTTVEGIGVKSAYLIHGGKRNYKVQNLIHLVQLGDKKVLHLGDTQMELDQFRNMRINYEDVDIAIVPFWYLTNHYGAELLKDYVGAKKYIGVHYPTQGSPESLKKIEALFPQATVFRSPGQKVTF